MKIFSPLIYNTNISSKVGQLYQADTKNNISLYTNLGALRFDTVHFGAMKKSEFAGFDLAVVEKYKAPIEKFKSHNDFDDWANDKTLDIYYKSYPGRNENTRLQRQFILDDWTDYVLHENYAYTPAMKLIILDSATKNLKPNNDKLPPVLNKGVLADCISELVEKLKTNQKQGFDFSKIYEKRLYSSYLEGLEGNEKNDATNSQWVVIPSRENDPKDFKANVEELKALSHSNWCTKSFNAEPYLTDGDFHIYLENGKPKLGIRFVGDSIAEIQGEKNNSKIPVSYFDTVNQYIKDNMFDLSRFADVQLSEAEELKDTTAEVKDDLSEAIKDKDTATILNYFGITTEKRPDGKLVISHYGPASINYSYSDIGVNENDLFKDISEIEGNASFTDSDVTDLGNLEKIGLSAFFDYSNVTNLGKLKEIGNCAYFTHAPIQDLKNLEKIGGYSTFTGSNINNLGNLRYIGGNAIITGSKLKADDFKRVEVKGNISLKR